MKRFWLGLLVGVLVVPVGALLYLRLGNLPVAVEDAPLPFEKKLVRGPLGARIDREMPKEVPRPAKEAVFVEGADIYQAQCAPCHGVPGRPSTFGGHMFPRAPQLFEKHGDHLGVTDDPPGETYWIVKNGIRLTGMPSYAKVLTEDQIWEVTLLLAKADKVRPAILERLSAPVAPPVAPPALVNKPLDLPGPAPANPSPSPP